MIVPSITFLRSWRGRDAGHIDSRLTLGVMTTLVQCGTAKWTETKQDEESEKPQSVASFQQRKKR